MARKAIKIDDTQRTLEIRPPQSGTLYEKLIVQIPDLMQRANRRQYQQCRNYSFRVKGLETGGTTARHYQIYTLSNAWWVKRSIEFAKAVWMKSTSKERKLLGDKAGKWNDFIIAAEEAVSTQIYADLYQYANPTDGTAALTAEEVATDETLYEDQDVSQVEGDQDDSNSPTKYGFTVAPTEQTGTSNSYNIFNQYIKTRQVVSPADTRDNPYPNLLSMDDVAMDSLKQDGDNAPYDLDAFPSPWVLQDVVMNDLEGSGRNTWSKFIDAPLGMVIIIKTGNDGSDVNFIAADSLLFELKKGTYKGVHAPIYRAAMELC